MSEGSDPDHPKDYEFDAEVRTAYLAPIFLKVKKPMDVMNVIHAYALKMRVGLIILSAVGAVGNVVFPSNIKKYYDEGIYQILSLTGRIVPHKMGEIIGDIHLIISNIHGATVGGVVESLVPETTVEVIVCPFYHDPVVSRRFDTHPPRLFGNLYLPSSSDSSSAGEQSHSAEPSSSSKPSPSNESSP